MNYAIVFENLSSIPMLDCKVSILGKPMLFYILNHLAKTKIDKTICMVEDYVLAKSFNQEITLPLIIKKLNDIVDLIDEDGYTVFLPANVLFLDEDCLNGMLSVHENNHHMITLGTMLLSRSTGYGRIKRKNRRVIKVVEEADATVSEKLINEVFSGIMCVNNQVLKSFLFYGKSSILDLVEYASKKYKVNTYMFTDKARGIRDISDLVFAEEKIREQICFKWLRSGVRLENPKTIIIGPEVIIEEQVTLFSNTRILGDSEIHKGAKIGPNTTIKNSIICKDASIRDSIIEDSYINEGTIIGPFAVKLGNQKVEK